MKKFQKKKQNNYLILLCLSLLSILIAILFIYKKQQAQNKRKFNLLLEKIEESQQQNSKKQYSKEKQISDTKVASILDTLQKFEQDNLYLNSNTSLHFVAKKLKTNTSYLSKIINEHKGQTFTNYITELRINYALHNLKNNKILRSYSIKAIAKELGFKSEGAFSRAFKKQTGIYPSFFIKNLTADL